jgi:hypothetical protein
VPSFEIDSLGEGVVSGEDTRVVVVEAFVEGNELDTGAAGVLLGSKTPVSVPGKQLRRGDQRPLPLGTLDLLADEPVAPGGEGTGACLLIGSRS